MSDNEKTAALASEVNFLMRGYWALMVLIMPGLLVFIFASAFPDGMKWPLVALAILTSGICLGLYNLSLREIRVVQNFCGDQL